nr:sulfatase-like hydrolase/transferase [uncultured Marvinbryantia sp.]
MKKKPHIIIFNPDQMRADALAHLGNPASSTPFLDEFARTDAVSFRNAFCQNPVCVPSRCSFFTGLYPHVRGHRTMQYLLHEDESNLFTELRDAGYYVWMNDRNDLMAGQIPGLFESAADEICYASGQSDAPGPEKHLRGKPGDKNYYSHFEGRLGLDAQGRNYSADDIAVDAAIDRILHPADERPLCLFLGLMYPHPPYAVEEPYFSMIDRKKLPRRAGRGEGKPVLQKRLREYMQMDDYTGEDWDELRACYLGMCRKVDDQFRRLCDALKQAGIYDDSAIFFLSDHGDYTGDYDIPEKAQNTFEDCLTRVPLLIKPPKMEHTDPGIADALTELVDFYATVMDYAGAEPTQDQFGKSLRPILEDRTKPGRKYVFCEGGRMPYELQCDEYHAAAGKSQKVPMESLYYPRQLAQTDAEAHTKGTMIRSEQFKYVHRASGAHEFYDLKKDPLEEKNCCGKAEYEKEILDMRMAMLDWYQTTCDVVPREYDRRFTKEALWRRVQKNCPPGEEERIRALIDSGAGPAMIAAEIERRSKEHI